MASKYDRPGREIDALICYGVLKQPHNFIPLPYSSDINLSLSLMGIKDSWMWDIKRYTSGTFDVSVSIMIFDYSLIAYTEVAKDEEDLARAICMCCLRAESIVKRRKSPKKS